MTVKEFDNLRCGDIIHWGNSGTTIANFINRTDKLIKPFAESKWYSYRYVQTGCGKATHSYGPCGKMKIIEGLEYDETANLI